MSMEFMDESGVILPNQPRQVTRTATETKGLLTQEGQMYYGTGGTLDQISYENDTITYNIPETRATNPIPENATNGKYKLVATINDGHIVKIEWVKEEELIS